METNRRLRLGIRKQLNRASNGTRSITQSDFTTRSITQPFATRSITQSDFASSALHGLELILTPGTRLN
ncbi:hypothetical protein L1887_23761 [Cichorium endivia]|nr:hypothetical protein L1887_23761 [Cichorium endivia]